MAAGEEPLANQQCANVRVQLLTCEQLLAVFQAKSQAAANAAAASPTAFDLVRDL